MALLKVSKELIRLNPGVVNKITDYFENCTALPTESFEHIQVYNVFDSKKLEKSRCDDEVLLFFKKPTPKSEPIISGHRLEKCPD